MKGALWQILLHAFANALIGVGLIMAAVGLLLALSGLIAGQRAAWLRFGMLGAAVVLAALILHSLAWIG